MTAAATTQIAAFTVDAPAELIRLAVPVVANHLAIPASEAAAQLRQGRVQATSHMAAAGLIPLLQALGLSPTILVDQTVSLALQAPDKADAVRLAPNLARALCKEVAAVLLALRRPGGLVLTDLSPGKAAELRYELRRLHGLRLTEAAGLHDLFVLAPLELSISRALSRHLAVLGAKPCRFSGALAAGLTYVQAAQLRARFASPNIQLLNRAFQRFDLFLTGTDGLPAEDVAAFLSTRADLSGAMVEGVTPLSPLQIENGLTRAAALQFRADYAAIGLETCARLAWF